ncbi:MAG: hypothetical protein H6599_00950 [Flavobacteriales bacterium]|nr:hypothetical protein [Flavobacteriales bacterium]
MKKCTHLLLVGMLFLLVGCKEPPNHDVKVFFSFYSKEEAAKAREKMEKYKLMGFEIIKDEPYSFAFKMGNYITDEAIFRLLKKPEQLQFISPVELDLLKYYIPKEHFQSYVSHYSNNEQDRYNGLVNGSDNLQKLKESIEFEEKTKGQMPFQVYFSEPDGHGSVNLVLFDLDDCIYLGGNVKALAIRKEDHAQPAVVFEFHESRENDIYEFSHKNLGKPVALAINGTICTVATVANEISMPSLQVSGEQIVIKVLRSLFDDGELEIISIDISI